MGARRELIVMTSVLGETGSECVSYRFVPVLVFCWSCEAEYVFLSELKYGLYIIYYSLMKIMRVEFDMGAILWSFRQF